MNIFQVFLLLTVALIVVTIMRSRIILLERTLILLISIIAIYFVIFPNNATALANLVGIGRGVDLFFYLFILYTWFRFSLLDRKLQRSNNLLTNIVRKIAIENPVKRTKPLSHPRKK
jgi:hypothetical protein